MNACLPFVALPAHGTATPVVGAVEEKGEPPLGCSAGCICTSAAISDSAMRDVVFDETPVPPTTTEMPWLCSYCHPPALY